MMSPTFSLYLIFVVSFFLHLSSRISILGLMRFDLILMGVILSMLFLVGNGQVKGGEKLKTTKSLWIFIAYIIFTIPIVEWPGSVVRHGLENYAKVVPFFFFTVVLVNTEKRLKVFMLVFILCQIFRAIEPAYLHYTTGYWGDMATSTIGGRFSKLDRLGGAPHDIINSNQLAWVINTALPFMYYFLWKEGSAHKLLVLISSPILIYALLLTASRSGLLSLFVILLTIMYMGKRKFTRLMVGIVIIGPIALLIAGQLDTGLSTRYLSIFDRSVEGGDSASGRTRGVIKGLSTVANRPIVGHGLGTSLETNVNEIGGRGQLAHNLYVEVLQEVGIIGFILFMLYIKEMIKSLIQAKEILLRLSTKHSWLVNLITATQVWIVMDLFYSLSCFGLNSWEWYLFGGISTVCLKLAKDFAVQAPKLQVKVVSASA